MANARPEDKSIQSAAEATRRSGERTVEQMKQIGQTAAETADQAVHALERTAEQTKRISQTAADAGEEMARASANLLQQNAETLQNALRFGMDVTTTAMGCSADQLSRTFGISGDEAQEASERSARNAATIIRSTTMVARGMSGLSREYFEFARHQIENNMNHMSEFWRCRTPQDVAAVQSELMRDTVVSMLESSRKMADMSLKVADDAAKHITQAIERAQRAA